MAVSQNGFYYYSIINQSIDFICICQYTPNECVWYNDGCAQSSIIPFVTHESEFEMKI